MRKTWFLGLAAVLALAAGGWFLTERPLIVTVVQAETDVPLRLYGLGTVEARVLSRVGFEVGAALVSVSVDAGAAVTAGQELAALHPAEQEARVARARAAVAASAAGQAKAEAAVARAEAVLVQRRAANTRQKELARQDVASNQRAEEAQRDEEVARAELELAKADLGVIRAQGADAAAALRLEETLLGITGWSPLMMPLSSPGMSNREPW